MAACIDSSLNAESAAQFPEAQVAYRSRAHTAREIMARWQGGESYENLMTTLKVELALWRSDGPPGREAIHVGRVFAALCRTVGIDSPSLF